MLPSPPNKRRSREETWAEWEEPIPLHDAEGWELTIFKSGYEDEDFSCRTLPRTYIGRSLLERVSFQNTDLHGSRLCWNDFLECDFSDADLSQCDLRASVFQKCVFRGSFLVQADLRHSDFEDCDFAGADLRGVKITPEQEKKLALTEQQRQVINWQADDGPEPNGG